MTAGAIPQGVLDLIAKISARVTPLPCGIDYDEELDELEIWFEQSVELTVWQPNGLQYSYRDEELIKHLGESDEVPDWLQRFSNRTAEQRAELLERNKDRITRVGVSNFSRFCDAPLLQAFKDFSARCEIRRCRAMHAHDGEGDESS